jgi:VWFA-related protein
MSRGAQLFSAPRQPAIAEMMVKVMRQILVPLALLAGLAPAGEGQDPEPYKISVDVNLVVLHATVLDGKGRFVSDLAEGDFEVYQDGVRQTIRLFRHEDVPVTVGLVVDHSGSMRPKLREVVEAARTFARSSNEDDRMFVVNFNEHVTMGLPAAQRFTNRPDELQLAILRAPAAGETAVYDAVAAALEMLRTSEQEKKALILISDGGDNASSRTLSEVLKMAGQSSAVVYAIGIFDPDDADKNPGVLDRLARATGGEAFFPGQLDEVVAICERIARDIRNQYTIGFAPMATAQPGVYRAIRVVAGRTAHGKLSVRARSGYIAGGAK